MKCQQAGCKVKQANYSYAGRSYCRKHIVEIIKTVGDQLSECECGGMLFEEDADGNCRICGGTPPKPPTEGKQRPDPTPTKGVGKVLSAFPTSQAKKATAATSTATTANAGALPAKHSVSSPPKLLHPIPFVQPNKPLSPFAAKLRDSEMARSAASSNLPPHLIVEARAGTGKTTTLIEGLKIMFGLGTTMVPSPQQKLVWEQMELSKGARTCCFAAFNNSIAAELSRRVPRGCPARTLHSLGLYAVRRTFELLPGEDGINANRTQEILCRMLDSDIRKLRKEKPGLVKAVCALIEKCKMSLVDPSHDANCGVETVLRNLARHYDIDLPDVYAQEVCILVPTILDLAKDVTTDKCIDFCDMVWLPIVLNLPTIVNDVLLVDEAQDLNRCQQEFARKIGRRLILVGDRHQSIYGFAGADTESLDRMERVLGEDARGVVTAPLTVTRRCGKAIVEEAKSLVADFSAFETNPEGKVSYAAYPTQRRNRENGRGWETYELPYEQTYLPLVQDSDMILCRANAPLIKQCLRFIQAGRKAYIQGRKDVGQGLVDLIEKLEASDVPNLIAKLSDWQQGEIAKEQAERHPNEARIQAVSDKAECIRCFVNVASSVQDVIARIQALFTDNQQAAGIKLSSIHKAKGLESRRVFYIQGFGRPPDKIKNEWERVQEKNLQYVAITRAIEELIYVS